MFSIKRTNINIFIIPHPKNFYYPYSCPRTEMSCLEALSKMDNINLVNKEDLSDFNILFYVPHTNKDDKYNTEFINKYNLKKTIVIDNSDEYNKFYTDIYLAYFKRSWFDLNGNIINVKERMFPYSYSIMNDYLKFPIPHSWYKRPIDIGCYLRPTCRNRSIILRLMSQLKFQNPQLNIIVGSLNQSSRSINDKPFFDETYFYTLGQTKILIHTDPTEWIGDNRFAESISQGCLTFTNTRFDHLPNPYKNNEHIIQYDVNNLDYLVDKINDSLGNYVNAYNIASNGYLHGMEYHTSISRMKWVLEKVKGIL